MSRISRHEAYLQIAEVISKRSTCARGANGCVIIENSRLVPVAIAYNGSESGSEHCNPNLCDWKDIRMGPCKWAVHAEENALRQVGLIILNVNIYITSSPCLTCTERLISSKLIISSIYFRNLYHKTEHLKLLWEKNIDLYQLTPLYKINSITGEVSEARP